MPQVLFFECLHRFGLNYVFSVHRLERFELFGSNCDTNSFLLGILIKKLFSLVRHWVVECCQRRRDILSRRGNVRASVPCFRRLSQLARIEKRQVWWKRRRIFFYNHLWGWLLGLHDIFNDSAIHGLIEDRSFERFRSWRNFLESRRVDGRPQIFAVSLHQAETYIWAPV